MTGSNTGATWFAAFLLVSGVVASQPQSGPTLNALTVPSKALPSGCALEEPAPSPPETSSRAERTAVRSAAWSVFPGNPWSGTDRRLVAEVRKVIDGTPRLPDGPPLGPRDAAAFMLKLADNVVEAYRATYVSTGGSQVAVWAVRFNDDTLAKTEPLWTATNPPPGFRNRVVRGATVVVVTAPSANPCARAVDAHIRSLE